MIYLILNILDKAGDILFGAFILDIAVLIFIAVMVNELKAK